LDVRLVISTDHARGDLDNVFQPLEDQAIQQGKDENHAEGKGRYRDQYKNVSRALHGYIGGRYIMHDKHCANGVPRDIVNGKNTADKA
jgi:hypothetical protein